MFISHILQSWIFFSWRGTLNAGCFRIINLWMSFFFSSQCNVLIFWYHRFFSLVPFFLSSQLQWKTVNNITAHRLFLVVRLFLKELIADEVLRHIFSNRKKKSWENPELSYGNSGRGNLVFVGFVLCFARNPFFIPVFSFAWLPC